MAHSYCAHGIDVENYHCVKCPPSALDKLREILADHIATLEGCGFGSDTSINGADAVDAVNEHFEELRDALGAIDTELPASAHGEAYKYMLQVFPDD
jgi:hypothetical protein